jgi:hypothetical protein
MDGTEFSTRSRLRKTVRDEDPGMGEFDGRRVLVIGGPTI